MKPTQTAVHALMGVLVLSQGRAADWPCFRGPNHNGVVDEKIELLAGGPKKLWESAVGEGNASFAVLRGRLFTMARQPESSVVCLDANSGQRLWLTPVKTWFRDATPAVENGRVYAFASQDIPRAYCLDAETGRVLWQRELAKSTGDRQYGHAGSPLVWNDLVLLNAAGGVALNKQNGEVVWSHEGFPGLAAPVLFQWKNRPCVAIFGGDQLIARDARSGQELFRIPWKTQLAVNACDPIVIGEKIFLCSDYGRGRALYDFSSGQPKALWEFGQGHGSVHSSGFVIDGAVYCFVGQKFCRLDLATGKPMWETDGGITALVLGDKVIRLGFRGDLTVARISPQGLEKLLSANLGMTDIKNIPAYSQGRLFIRNEKGVVTCWQIAQ